MLFDTHTHFEKSDEADGFQALMTRASAAGVTRLMAVGASAEMNRLAVEVARKYPAQAFLSLGFDRDQVRSGDGKMDLVADLKRQIEGVVRSGVRVWAVGEMGLDFHYHPQTKDLQMELFRQQLELAAELGLPVIIHSREADEETLVALREHAKNWRGPAERIGVLHCFTGSAPFAQSLLDLGFRISFSGIMTFRNAESLRDVAKGLPEDILLIETDSPFLAPVPHRGKRNEPAFVKDVAVGLAQVRGKSLEDIAEITTRNACRLFGIEMGRNPLPPMETDERR